MPAVRVKTQATREDPPSVSISSKTKNKKYVIETHSNFRIVDLTFHCRRSKMRKIHTDIDPFEDEAQWSENERDMEKEAKQVLI